MKFMMNKFSKFIFVFVLLGCGFLFAKSASAATYYWVGGATNSNTSNTANWNTTAGACADSANVTAPTTGDTINFVSNCLNNATVDSALSVAGFNMQAGYTGTSTVSGISMTVSTSLIVDGGTLYITNVGTVTGPSGSGGFIIGSSATSNGTVTVTGSGSNLTQTISGDTRIRVGNSTGAIGTLNILNGAGASVGNIYAGYSTGTTANITVDGTGTVLNSGTTACNVGYIGRQGSATFTITNGAVINTNSCPWQIGGMAGSIGSVTVSGTNSKINFTVDSLNLRVGYAGTGSLTVQNGGTVGMSGITLRKVTVADQTGSNGTLTIGSGYTLDVISATIFAIGVGTATLPPVATTTITGTGASGTSIAWDWSDESGATGYKVYRSSDNTLLATISSATSNWTQDSLSANTSYSIYYRGTNTNGEGASSTPATAYTLASVPSVPTLTASSFSSLKLTLNTNANPASTNFSIYNSTAGKYLQADGTLGDIAVWQTYTSWGGSSGITMTGLSENTQYTYQIVARNGDNVVTASSPNTSKFTLSATDLLNFNGAMSQIEAETKSNTTIAIIGDSWTAGQHFVPYMYDYISSNFFAGVGYVPVDSYQYNLVLSGATKTSTGTWTDSNDNGGIGPNISHTTSSDTATPASKSVSCVGTQFNILYLKKSGGGSFDYAIDNESAVTVNTSNATNELGVVNITAGAQTSHTISMTVNTAGSTGVTLFGVDCTVVNAHGIKIQKLGMSGATATKFAAAPAALWQSEISTLNPDLVIISLGTNDIVNTSVETFIGKIQTIIANVKAANSNIDILLAPPAVGTRTGPAGDVSAYYTPLRDLAEQNGYGYVQAGDDIGPYESATQNGLWFDGVHLSASGDQVFANAILKYLGLYSANSFLYTLSDTPTNLSASLNSNNITLTVDSFPNDTSGQSGYYFSRSGANSGWIQTNSWTDTGLSCGNSYTYSVKYRNGDSTETSEISTTKSTSGCGGGGMPAGWSNLPITPIGGFKVTVNQGVSTTSNRIVNLNFNAGSDVKKMAISLTGDFSDASQENYSATKQVDLCSKFGGLIKNPTCPDGKYTVYAQFYTVYGRSSANAVASSTIILKSGVATTENLQPVINNLPAIGSFTKYLQYRQTNADIKRLQIFLNSDPDTKIANSGVGSPGKETNYFGLLTYKAVIKFQEKYAKDILLPWGLKKGTGYVGKTTLLKINELIGNK
jgi:T5SS/PEP-CTERM-associated repeat protein